MNENKHYQSVLFDFDGTLIDSWPALNEATRRTYEYFKPMEDSSHIRLFKSNHNDHRTFFKAAFKVSEVEQHVIEHAERIYLEIILEKTTLFPEVEDVICFLNKKNIPWGIVTHRRKFSAKKLLSHFKNLNGYKSLVCYEDVTQKKPDAEGLLIACEELKVNPLNTFYVGDSENDILAAKNCNMGSICALWGYAKDFETAKTWRADAYITNISEIKKYFTEH